MWKVSIQQSYIYIQKHINSNNQIKLLKLQNIKNII